MASTSTTALQSEIKITNASDGLASPFASASASTFATSSSPLQKLPCNIFINHRGADVKHTLAKAIYNALHATGLRVFLDSEELELGDFLPATLEETMRSASLHLAIFSPTYAQSPWCLAELSFLLKSGTPIIPVFYRVQPSDLRWAARGKGLYVNAFMEHQEKGRYSSEKLEEWKMALHNVSFYKGEIINNDNEEQWVLKNVVYRVSKVMKTVPFEVAKHPVGLEEAVADFEMTVRESAKTHPNVQIVGIWGMSGSGKTTLAKELYNRKQLYVERSSFLFDVGDSAAKSQLHKNQTKLLQDLGFNDQYGNIKQGQTILSNLLRSIRVLVVLDDVDHIDQLDALLPAKDNLAWGSLIIVTTREKKVLKCWGISSIYEMKAMSHTHVEQLFCWHAFLQPSPLLGFEELVEKFASACNGLPLSVKVLGSHLYGCSSKDLWNDLLQQISNIFSNDIKNKLRVSYDALDEEEKQIFLDVACFFIGKDKVIATAVWEGSGWNALYGWEMLVNKCLVDLDDNNCIRMQHHLRDLGREIANTQSPYRLWSLEQIRCIQKQKEDVIQIRGMMLNAATNDVHNSPTFPLNTSIGLCGFRRTRGPFSVGLKIFVARGYYKNNLHIAKLSRELAWLSWTESAHRNLPAWLSLKNLRVLELHNSQKLVGLWKDRAEAPVQLRVLSISYCPKLRRIPKSIGYLYNLKKIVLRGSNHLRKVDILPTAVEDIQVKDCKSLRNINGIGDVINLRELKLSDCPALDALPSFDKLASLEVFVLEGGNKVENIQGLHHCTSLEKLVISGCPELNAFPSLGDLIYLKVFELKDCNKVEKVQGLQQCTSLEKLMLHCKRWELPGIESLEKLQRLRRLQLIAKKSSAVEPCIKTIQTWPGEIIICTKAVASSELFLNSSAFPNLSVLSFANKKINYLASHFITLPQKHSSNATAIMLCLVINCLSLHMEMAVKLDLFDTVFSTKVEEGKWTLIGVFTQHSRCLTAQNFYIRQGRAESHEEQTELISKGGEVEKGVVVTGEELFIVEAFHRLMALQGS